jgi:hypothetical protein
VEELLNRMNSRELTEWMAYERHAGPLGPQWRYELLSSLHEQLQQLNYLFSQANFTDKNKKKGPVPKPEKYPRPHESYRRQLAREREKESDSGTGTQ